MLKKILAVIAVLVVVFGIMVALEPDEFKLSRSVNIAAPPAAVFARVNDFHQWEAWSPWAKLDAAMKTTYEGPAAGEGAQYSWVGNNQVGEGKMTIVRSQAPDLVQVKLDFLRPMVSTSMTEFTFKTEGAGTFTTWTMSGKNNLAAKAFHVVASMEKLLGPDFEKGLTQLKALVESAK